MQEYRIYLLNSSDIITDFRVLDCESDDEATMVARGLLEEHPRIEIRSGARIVGRMTAEGTRLKNSR
jgi:hypothetical protein